MKIFDYLAIVFFCWVILVLLGFGFLVIPLGFPEYVRELAISMPIAMVVGAICAILGNQQD